MTEIRGLLAFVRIAADAVAVTVQTVGEAWVVTMERRDACGSDLVTAGILVARRQGIEDGLPQLRAYPGLAQEFRRAFSEMGARIAIFQAKWSAALLAQNDDEFISDRETLREQNGLVAEWALRTLH
jgi:hypothetical protein